MDNEFIAIISNIQSYGEKPELWLRSKFIALPNHPGEEEMRRILHDKPQEAFSKKVQEKIQFEGYLLWWMK